MKRTNKTAIIVLLAIMSIATTYSFYILFRLPSDLERSSSSIDLGSINDALAVFNHLYLVIGTTLLIFMSISMWFFYSLWTAQQKQPITAKDEVIQPIEVAKIPSNEHAVKTTLQDDVLRDAHLSAKNLLESEHRSQKLLSSICKSIEASVGLFYEVKKEGRKTFAELSATFAIRTPKEEVIRYGIGEGLVGQVAKTGQKMNLDDLPEGYVEISSGLGSSSPKHLAIIPITYHKKLIAVVEVASFKKISSFDEELILETFKPFDRKSKKTPDLKNQRRIKKSLPIPEVND